MLALVLWALTLAVLMAAFGWLWLLRQWGAAADGTRAAYTQMGGASAELLEQSNRFLSTFGGLSASGARLDVLAPVWQAGMQVLQSWGLAALADAAVARLADGAL